MQYAFAFFHRPVGFPPTSQGLGTSFPFHLLGPSPCSYFVLWTLFLYYSRCCSLSCIRIVGTCLSGRACNREPLRAVILNSPLDPSRVPLGSLAYNSSLVTVKLKKNCLLWVYLNNLKKILPDLVPTHEYTPKSCTVYNEIEIYDVKIF